MSRRKKPGVPGKTKIPAEVVAWATEQLRAVFARHGENDEFELVVVPQQGYLYVEMERREGCDRAQAAVKSSTARTRLPLGRLRFVTEEEWVYEPYRWADWCWDERSTERGTLDDMMLSAIVHKFSA